MNKKKNLFVRLFAVGTAASLLLSVTGCAKTDGSNNGATPPAATEEELTAVRDGLVKKSQTEGLGDISKLEFYENGERTAAAEMNTARDNKIVYYAGDIKRVVNYPDGYIIDIPQDWAPDYSMSPLKVRYSNDDVLVTISVEDVVEKDARLHLEKYVNKYILDEKYQAKNRVTQLADVEEYPCSGGYTAQIVRLRMERMPDGSKPYFTYVNIFSERTKYYRFLFRSNEPVENLYDIIDSFDHISEKGLAVYNMEYHISEPANWTEETAELYHRICNSNTYEFGMYPANIEESGYNFNVPAFEERTNYFMPIISQYIHSGSDGGTLNMDFYQRLHDEGRILQLTYQYTASNNMGLDGYSVTLDIYRGLMDEQLRSFARQVKEYGHPVLFRLNNEMNSDWTSYCALANMADTDIFVDTWVRLYNICQEEGANNMIWIFDPNTGSFPPGTWTNVLNYMPPAEYMHMVGLTAYCTGYKEFDSWKDMYAQALSELKPFFQDDEWPICIPEYGCGKGDGTRSEEQYAWIEQMFQQTKEMPQIKYGVWFSANDYNLEDDSILNYYHIDVREKGLMEAFRKGLASLGKK